jgi:hypothetical protein
VEEPLRGAHHDLAVLPSGDIVVLTRKAQVVPAIDDETPVLEDFISILGPDGRREVAPLSLLEALDRSPFQALWQDVRARAAATSCTRTRSTCSTRTAADAVPAFRAGNLLVSSRALSFLAVVDPVRAARSSGRCRARSAGQHDPRLLPNGHLLLFDNCGRGEASTVVELDPAKRPHAVGVPRHGRVAVLLAFLRDGRAPGEREHADHRVGRGRAFEVTPAGEIVWEF